MAEQQQAARDAAKAAKAAEKAAKAAERREAREQRETAREEAELEAMLRRIPKSILNGSTAGVAGDEFDLLVRCSAQEVASEYPQFAAALEPLLADRNTLTFYNTWLQGLTTAYGAGHDASKAHKLLALQTHQVHERILALRAALRALHGTSPPSDSHLVGALGFLRERVEAKFIAMNAAEEAAIAGATPECFVLSPGVRCVPMNVGGAIVHSEVRIARKYKYARPYLRLLRKLVDTSGGHDSVEKKFVDTRTRYSHNARTKITEAALDWLVSLEEQLAPQLTEKALIQNGKETMNNAIAGIYRNVSIDAAWFALVGEGSRSAGCTRCGTRLGLKLRLLRRFAHTRAKAFCKELTEHLRVRGIAIRSQLKATMAAKAAKKTTGGEEVAGDEEHEGEE